jgi:aminopeptidase N
MRADTRNLRSRLTAAGSAALLGLAGGAIATGPAYAGGHHPTPGSAGLGDRLYPLLGNGGYDVLNYDLRLTYPRKDPAQQVRGDVTITAVATQALSRFDLDFGGDGVGKVTVDGRAATFSRAGDELVITPRRPLADHRRFTVTVSGFTATPIAPNASSPAGFVVTPDGTVMAGQPDQSHQLFPSNDHPRDKASYTISMTAPTGWTSVANGRLVRTTRHGGYVTSTYRESHPMASELIQVAVGDFGVYYRRPVNGTPVRDVVPPRLSAELLPKAADERNEIAFMESKVGRYPFDKYGSLIIDGDLGFALETQGLSLYDTSFFSLPQVILNPILNHELAHQWFGDSVAPWEWSDVWQNEGHATWYEVLYAYETGTLPQYAGVSTLEDYYKKVYARGDQFRTRYGPVARPLKADSIWDVFNPNVYDGGALVLFALRQQIGTPKFEQLERAWVAKYRGRSASSQDFINLASRVSGQNLQAFMTAWLYGSKTPPMPGHPDWTVNPVTPAAASAALAPLSPAARLR